jgi:hypothetical protein
MFGSQTFLTNPLLMKTASMRVGVLVFFLGLLLFFIIKTPALAEDIPVDEPLDNAAPQPAPAAESALPDVSLIPPGVMETKAMAVLQALDKVTGRVHVLNVVVDQPARFASLTLRVRSCRKSLPEDSPESAAFLDIQDTSPKGEKKTVFSGWMFASSPAVSAMEHPMFDVWVVDCRN